MAVEREITSFKAGLRDWIGRGRKPEEIPQGLGIEHYLTPTGVEKLGWEAIERINRLEGWSPEDWMFDQP